MDLNDFGTKCNSEPRHGHNSDNGAYQPPATYSADTPLMPIQWKVAMPGLFEACGMTYRKLPAGAYVCSVNQYGEPQLLAKDLQVDDLIDFANSLP